MILLFFRNLSWILKNPRGISNFEPPKQKLQKHVTNLSKYKALTRNSIRERSIWSWEYALIQNSWKSTKTWRQKIIDFCLNFGQLQLDLAPSSEGVRNFRWTFWKALIFLFRLLWFLFHFRHFWKTRGYAY